MNHLEAFLSEDAKRGRVWTDGCSGYKRHYNQLWMDAHRDGAWKFWDEQVAAMDDDVTWVADEPPTLTPQEALRALADGKVLRDEDVTVWVGFDGTFRGPNKDGIDGPVTIHRLGGFRIVSSPSQPAEGDCHVIERQSEPNGTGVFDEDGNEYVSLVGRPAGSLPADREAK